MIDSTWKSGITLVEPERILIRGFYLMHLMKELSFSDVIFLVLFGRLPNERESKLFNAILISSIDHGPSAPSALASRVVVSGNRESLSAGIAAGILAIGDYHGGAGEKVSIMLQRAISLIKEKGYDIKRAAEIIVEEYKGQRIPGIGHRVHKKEDMRSTLLFKLEKELGFSSEYANLLENIKDVINRRANKELPINLDGAIAATLCDMGLTDPKAAKAVFIISRTVGIIAHVCEELEKEKPMRIHVSYEYIGPKEPK